MAIDRKDVEHVARLARLALSEDEKTMLQEQLSKILGHAERVTALDTEGVESTTHAIALVNVFRPDEKVAGLSQSEAVEGAPQPEGGQFRVPRILEDGS
jgi:aspartyl-tRNA(Asn)/glutamyl-tRNA(Gln) amidotransferase subunit C